MPVRIVTDSTCDLPREHLDKYDIRVVPLKVYFGEEEFRDGVDITTEEFYRRLSSQDILPRTSQPTPGEFEEVYKNTAAGGDTVLSIHISADLSGTFQSALLARKALPEMDIEVVDSRLVSIPLGLVVLTAARAARLGWSKREILDLVEKVRQEIAVFFLPATLTYLEKGGRIGKAQALLGSILDIKPICSFDEGMVVSVEKVRTRGKGIARIFELLQEPFDPAQELTLALVHGGAKSALEPLVNRVKEEFRCKEIIVSELGPVVGTHGGPGIIGIMAMPAYF